VTPTPHSHFDAPRRCLRRYKTEDGGTVAVLEPVLCIKRYAVDGGTIAVLEPVRCH